MSYEYPWVSFAVIYPSNTIKKNSYKSLLKDNIKTTYPGDKDIERNSSGAEIRTSLE